MLEPFIDTICVNTMTTLVILTSGQWLAQNESPAVMVAEAFNSSLPGGFGAWFVTISLILFAWTTILGWGLYGERCITYLFGRKWSLPFYCFFSCVVPAGCLLQLTVVWNFTDIANGLMAIPNLIALLLLSPVVFRLAKEFFSDRKHLEDHR
jgi:AGCS family alanine or glycine:cation symporter